MENSDLEQVGHEAYSHWLREFTHTVHSAPGFLCSFTTKPGSNHLFGLLLRILSVNEAEGTAIIT
jgi:hypothetical protein